MISIFHIRLATLLLLTSSLINGPAGASILFSHAGNNNPVDNSWVVNEPAISPDGRPATGEITDDGGAGVGAWFIDDDLTTIGSSWFYQQSPTSTQISQGKTFGWTLRANV